MRNRAARLLALACLAMAGCATEGSARSEGAAAGGPPHEASAPAEAAAPAEASPRAEGPEGTGADPATAARPVPPVIRLEPEEEREIDAAVGEALAQGVLPGCVVVVGRKDGLLFRRAYGQRAREPSPEPMTVDTVFDLASLTKPVATAATLMTLVDEGRVALDAPVARYLPAFSRGGKQAVTVRQLLTHSGGLPPVNPLRDYEGSRAVAVERILRVPLAYPPGQHARYTDLGFIVLGELVAAVAGKPLPEAAAERLFGPLGMGETGYLPDAALGARIAPTERRGGEVIRGVVDDPRAWRLGGVAGNAGLFSTADDLARYARMLLGEGTLEGSRVLSAEGVRAMGEAHALPNGLRRGLGWDMTSRAAQGLSARSFGHGGYTGTWLWVDPDKDVFVLFLSNRVHAESPGNVRPLTLKIAQVAGRTRAQPAPERGVLTGIDVLERDGFAALSGLRVGLVTNRSGVTRDGRTTVEALAAAPNVTLAALFAPEHGLAADREGHLGDGADGETGLPVYSLFGATRAPPPESLEGLDALVFDIQDAGVRFYTYASTMRRAMEAAGAAGLRFVVLDRPNPLGGLRVEGPLVDDAYASFVNHHPLPVLHGMTLGELAGLLADERGIEVELTVVPMEGWSRGMRFEDTGLRWVPPSPNLRTSAQAALYPAVGLLESTSLSVGRGTGTAFEVVGAPWVRARSTLRRLAAEGLPGVRFSPVRFRPTSGPHRRALCAGVRVEVTDPSTFEPVRTGLALARAFAEEHPEQLDLTAMGRMLADARALSALREGAPLARVEAGWREELGAFEARRAARLLYR